MDISIEGQHGVSIIRLKGDLTGETELLQTVTPLLAQDEPKIILDLEAIGMITSAGLGDLVTLAAHANTNKGQLLLAGPSAFVRDVFATTHLDRFFEIADSAEEGVKLVVK